MISEIEAAVAAYLSAQFAADESLTAGTWEVKPATAVTAAAKNKGLIAVAAASAPQIHPKLLEAMVHIHVSTPAEPASMAGLHSLFERAVARAFSADDNPTVEADIAEQITERLPDWGGGGIFATGWQAGREQVNFNPHYELKVGLVRTD